MTPQVAVLIDYQNAHFTPHEIWCDEDSPKHLCLIHPLKLAELLVARRAGGGELVAVRVFRGKPLARLQPTAAKYSDRQADEWEKDPRVVIRRRTLRYPRNFGEEDCIDKPQEKGVDVELAVTLVAAAIRKEFDSVIVVSHDTDLLPAIELAHEVGAHVEVAAWGSDGHRLRGPGIRYCHILNETDFVAVRDLRDYNVKRRDQRLVDPASLMNRQPANE